MEKQAVVRKGKTPSEVSGKPSTMIKNGKALAPGEKDETAASEERLWSATKPLLPASQSNASAGNRQ